MEKVRVLIAEDSETLLQLLVRTFEQDGRFTVVGIARNGQEAIDQTILLKPDVVTMDLVMPKVDGFEAIKQIMARRPTPIVVVTSSTDSNSSFEAVRAGALDVVSKPVLINTPEGAKVLATVLEKAKTLAGVKVLTRKTNLLAPAQTSPLNLPKTPSGNLNFQPKFPSRRLSTIPKVIAIASSTGGPPALSKLLAQIGNTYPLPILIVQHITPGFGKGLVDWLSRSIGSHILEAREDMLPLSNHVYIAPDNFHLLVSANGRLKLSSALPIKGHRPAANLLFESVATYYQSSAVAVVLTGMGDDGMTGVKSIKQAGGFCVAQDEASCVVYGMPKAVIDGGLADAILNINDIGSYLLTLVK